MANDPIDGILEPDETIQAVARARTHQIVVTDRRVAVADEQRLALHVDFPSLRRIQFDIERDRPATLVIVPERPSDEPQVLAVPPEAYPEIAQVLVIIGQRLAS